MSKNPYVSALDIHREQASRNLIDLPARKTIGPKPSGSEIRCLVGGPNEQAIEALYHPASRTVYPVKDAS